MNNFTKDIEKLLKNCIEELEQDINNFPEKYIEIAENNHMKCLDLETEELLKEILENESDYPRILRDKLENLSYQEDKRIRAKIKELRINGYISDLSWGDGLPVFGRIEQKGRSYFVMKEMDEIKDFSSWEKVLYKIIKAYKNVVDFKMTKEISLEIEYLLQRNLITALEVTTLSDTCKQYIEIKPTMKGMDYFANRDKNEATSFTNIINNYGSVENLQQGSQNSMQMTTNSFNDIESIFAEIRKEINNFNLNKNGQTDLLEMIDEAEDANKRNKKGKLKTILIGLGGILKDFTVGVAASVIASKL